MRAFNLSLEDAAIVTLTRGVCAAGERQGIDSNGHLACMRAPAYPSALNTEAAAPSASTDHERACGRWIDSRSTPSTDEWFSFYDEDTIASDVTDQIQAETVNVEVDDVSRFRSACERMVINSAAAPAAEAAYEYLKGLMGAATSSQADALRQLGVLAAHYCDAPLSVATSILDSSFRVTALDGVQLSQDAATAALYSYAEASEVRERAREFVAEMSSAPASLLTTPTDAQLDAIVSGAIGNSWLSDSITIHGTYSVRRKDTLHVLERFLYATEETSTAHAYAYLLASASRCSFAARAVVTGEFGLDAGVRRVAGRRVVGLGRVEASAVDRFAPVEAQMVLEVNAIRWSSLGAASLAGQSQTEAVAACWSAAKRIFPDKLDERVFQKMTTSKLIDDLLPPMVSALKTAVSVEFQSGRTAPIVADPNERARIAASATSAQIKIAGAPRGSAFGRSGDFQEPAIFSKDGALLILLKQGNAVFLDRMQLAVEHADACDHPALFPSTWRNAYMLVGSSCSMLMPGILVPPFASDRYDTASLYGRIGYVVAHELAHIASVREIWDESAASELLANYSTDVYAEAAADLTGVDAVMATGRVSAEQLCLHVSQLWCARTATSRDSTGVHPGPNVRGDNACAWIRR
jgi:hypothetical protein